MLVGVVAPFLTASGGVESVAEMVIRQIESSATHDYVLISLATAASDELSTSLRRPWTLARGPLVQETTWRGRRMLHVGCSLAELEFMRYRRRDALTRLLANCDVIQVVSGFPAWGVAVLDCGRPVSVWAATRSAWERRSLLSARGGVMTVWRRLMTRLTDRLDGRAVRRADAMLIGNDLMREYVTQMRRDREQRTVVFAPPGVDTVWLQPTADRLSGSWPPRDSYVLSVGRFSDARKKPEALLEAFALARPRLGATRLILAGVSGPSPAFWRRVSLLGLDKSVSFHENPDPLQLKGLYQGATCLALSSDEEGFGMVLVEAMACAVPVIATRCGGPEAIITDGVDGFLVEVGDAAAMAERLVALVSNSDVNLRMGHEARRKVVDRFSEQATRAAFFDTWANLVNDGA